ncbi:unnamed protein product [Polarella glacialis]|uniref:EF-hand domain-containing protein n=1 Tax=Polarella glacialis TaxID=89957 RepID=A0A813DRZ7_POLGL|nr:unnamed protein product [Polarella glacialis]
MADALLPAKLRLEMQSILEKEMKQLSADLTRDLRQDLSVFLAEWSKAEQALAKQCSLLTGGSSEVLESADADIFPQTRTPRARNNSVSSMSSTSMIRARTWVAHDGRGAPITPSGMTMLGTPKYGMTLSRQNSPNLAPRTPRQSVSLPMRALAELAQAEQFPEPQPSWSDPVKREELQSIPSARQLQPSDSSANIMGRRGSEVQQLGSVSSRLADRKVKKNSVFLHMKTTRDSQLILESDDDLSPSTSSAVGSAQGCWRSFRVKVSWLVNLEYFDYVMGIVIMFNAVLMGIQADYAVKSARIDEPEPASLAIISVGLGIIFTVELALRCIAQGVGFFIGMGWRWNLFDLFLVTMQMGEEIVAAIVFSINHNAFSSPVNLSVMRILRVLRLIRIIRLVRILRLIRELRTMVASIASTMTSLLWTVVLLLLLIFVVGICFTQVVADFAMDEPDLLAEGTSAFEYYGSLDRSVISLYQAMTNGIGWRELLKPLADKQPFMAIVFCFYIAFAVLAMLNVITGVFVESAMSSSREEDNIDMVNRLRELVENMDVGKSGRMTWEQFESQLSNPMMEAYFKSLDLSLSEAHSLFTLLDIDDEGSIDAEDFVMSCLRIHGPAKAIDLTTLMCEVHMLHHQWLEHAIVVEAALFPSTPPSQLPTQAGSPASHLGRRRSVSSVGVGSPRSRRPNLLAARRFQLELEEDQLSGNSGNLDQDSLPVPFLTRLPVTARLGSASARQEKHDLANNEGSKESNDKGAGFSLKL